MIIDKGVSLAGQTEHTLTIEAPFVNIVNCKVLRDVVINYPHVTLRDSVIYGNVYINAPEVVLVGCDILGDVKGNFGKQSRLILCRIGASKEYKYIIEVYEERRFKETPFAELIKELSLEDL